MASMATPTGILKTPRVFLVVVFPLVSFILYLAVSLGCITDSISGISPVTAKSDGLVTVGGQDLQVDIHIGFFGVCFGPAPYNCTPSTAALPTTPSEAQLASAIPDAKGGDNFALAGLALGLQSSFAVLSGLPLLLLLAASLLANLIQAYLSTRTRNPNNSNSDVQSSRQRHAQAALWARTLDFAAAASALTSFAAYQAIVGAASGLLQAVSGLPLTVAVGGTASNLFAAVVALTVFGAVVNTALTAGDAGFDAYLAGKRRGEDGVGMGMGREVRKVGGGKEGEAVVMYQARAAYERFP